MNDFRKDLMVHVNEAEVSQSMMGMLTHTQNFRKEVQMLSIAALFLFMCDRWRVDPSYCLSVVENIITSNGTLPEFKAAKAYVSQEFS